MRPEIIAWAKRRSGLLAAVVLALGAGVLLGPAAVSGGPLAVVGLAVALAAAAALARHDMLRARLAPGGGPGLVAVREGRVAYFGPEGGGMADLDALTSVALARGPHGPVWLLRGADGSILRAPAAAEGADALIDAFAALPGFEEGRVSRALSAEVETEVWRRGGAAPIALPRGG